MTFEMLIAVIFLCFFVYFLNLQTSKNFLWSDDRFRSLIRLNGVNSRPDLTLSVECTKSFLNWYTSGDSPDNMCLMIAGMFGQAMNSSSSGYLFSSHLYTAHNGVSIPQPRGANKMYEFNYKCKSSNIKVIKWYGCIFNLLEGSEKKQRAAINYLSYLTMTMTRCIKSRESFIQRIPRISTDVVDIWCYSPETILETPPPKGTVLLRSSLQMYLQKCLIFTIASYAYTEDMKISSETLFHRACLHSLQYIGIDCYRWTADAAHVLGTSIDIVLSEAGKLPEFNEICSEVISIHHEYGLKLSQQRTWSWAGVLERHWFERVSLTANPLFCITMAILALGDDVGKVVSFKKYGKNMLIHAKGKAKKILKIMNPPRPINITESFYNT